MNYTIKGFYVDIPERNIYPATLSISNGKIEAVQPATDVPEHAGYILPGFIDSHVHIESSMLVPTEFARLAMVHGTIATISDPHEIANVCGLQGVDFMISNGKKAPLKFYFGAPSCVPATGFETAGAELNAKAVTTLLERPEIKYLSEMMNFPGVLADDESVMEKIAAAKALNKPVDGHAPGLTGDAVRKYIHAGISTDHECFTAPEARGKLELGMKVLIREGSAAKNFDALIDLLQEYPDDIMFCSDDKHPDSLEAGHINLLCKRAIEQGIDLFHVLNAACVNPVKHYNLEVGLLQVGDPADFIIVEDLNNFRVMKTVIDGITVAENGHTTYPIPEETVQINNFNCSLLSAEQLRYYPHELALNEDGSIPVIKAIDGQLITAKESFRPSVVHDRIPADPENDILYLVVVNRYHDAPPAKSFVKNFGLKSGAIASSVAHDSHNIVAVGVNEEELALAINALIRSKGGISCVKDGEVQVLPLPVAGLMSASNGYTVAQEYSRLDGLAKSLGSTLSAPFMTLSFMALLVIPHIKLSDKGLFDGDRFSIYE